MHLCKAKPEVSRNMIKKILILFLGILLFLSPVIAKEKEAIVPIDAKLEYNNGLDMYKLGKYEEAIACFRTAIRLYPDYIDAYYNLGMILEYLNQGDEAIYVLKQILARKPDDDEAAYKIAQISVKLGDRTVASQYIAMIPPTSEYYIKGKELMMKHGLQKVPPPGKTKSKLPEHSGGYLNVTSPTGITTDAQGNVYIASFTDNAIIKVTPDNKRIIYFKNPILRGPISIASDTAGNLYIANYNANNVLKLSNTGRAEVFISNAAKPYAVHVGGNMLFVSCQGSNSVIRKRID